MEEFDNYIQPNTLVVSLGTLPLVADIQALPGVVRVEELGGPRFRIQFSDVKEAMNSIVEASYTRLAINGIAAGEEFFGSHFCRIVQKIVLNFICSKDENYI